MDNEISPQAEFLYEWNNNQISPNISFLLCGFFFSIGLHRFNLGQWRAALVIIVTLLGCAYLVMTVNESYVFLGALLYFYEIFTIKKRPRTYNAELKKRLAKKWGVWG